MSLEVKVIPVLDSLSLDTKKFDQVLIYENELIDEKQPLPQQCFLGAYYRKVVSSMDKWLGIEGVLTLGEFTPDETRFNLDGRNRYMDNPNIYMGGKSLYESDCGLGLANGYEDADNTNYVLNYGSKKVAYRPFWRYIYNDVKDHDGNVIRGSYNSYNMSDPTNFGYYYLPGDTVKMTVYSPKEDYLQLRITLVKPTTIPKYVAQRAKYGLKDNLPYDFYSPIFHSKGHGRLDAEFKRVNSLDQYGNEGIFAQPTNASVSKTTWHECYLYRKVDNKIVKVPLIGKRAFSMVCPTSEVLSVDYENVDKNLGGENISIAPKGIKL